MKMPPDVAAYVSRRAMSLQAYPFLISLIFQTIFTLFNNHFDSNNFDLIEKINTFVTLISIVDSLSCSISDSCSKIGLSM